MITRRGLITGLATFLAAPAIVRAGSLMPVKAWRAEYGPQWVDVTNFEPSTPVRFLGLAQLKQEGTPVVFDTGYRYTRYPAGEQIYAGDSVFVGTDGRVYRSTDFTVTENKHVGFAAGNSGPMRFLPT